MTSPFPGMNPYLEDPEFWPEVHNRLIVALADALIPSLRPTYHVAIEKRTYLNDGQGSLLVELPDVSVLSTPVVTASSGTATATLSRPTPLMVTLPLEMEEVQERYLEIRETQTRTVVTTIEVLSPKNKRSGAGRDAYLHKRQHILSSLTHLVEIDLLRGGNPMPIQEADINSDYRILISRSQQRPAAHLYPFNLRDPIPRFSLPLQPNDAEPVVELQSILAGVYDRGDFQFRLDYSAALSPTLSTDDLHWLRQCLQQQSNPQQSNP